MNMLFYANGTLGQSHSETIFQNIHVLQYFDYFFFDETMSPSDKKSVKSYWYSGDR